MNAPEFDSLVIALREQAAAIERLASSLSQLASAIVSMIDEDDSEQPQPSRYLDGRVV